MTMALAHATPLRDGRIYVSLGGLLATAASAQAVVTGAPASSIFWALLLWGALAAGRASGRRPAPIYAQLSNGAAVVGLLGFLAQILFVGLVDGLLTLILWLQVAKAVTLATRRDAHFAMTLSFTVLAFAASISKSGSFLVFLAVYALAALYTLALLHAEKLRARALGVCDEGHRFPVSIVPLTLAVIGLATLLYLFVPRPAAIHIGAVAAPGGLSYEDDEWERQARENGGEENNAPQPPADDTLSGAEPSAEKEQDKRRRRSDRQEPPDESAYAGFEPQFRIDEPGREGEFDPNAILLYVQAPRALYLRGRVFDYFDGKRWRASSEAERKIAPVNDSFELSEKMKGERIDQVVMVERTLSDEIVATPQLASLRFPAQALAIDRYGSVRAPLRLRAGTQYQAISYLGDAQGHPAVADEGEGGRENYLQLPVNLDPAIAGLGTEITAGTADPFAAAVAIEEHLRNHYQYSFETIFTSQGVTPLSEFLFQTKKGHCEYFASAMTVLLRTQGIPARLATGFSATQYNPLTDYYEVRALDGHAWVEAWFPEHGWVSFEPTAFYRLPPPAPPPTVAQALDDYVQEMARADEITRPGDARNWAQVMSGLFTAIKRAFWGLMAWLAHAGPLLAMAGAVVAAVGLALFHLRVPVRDALGRMRVGAARRQGGNRLVLVAWWEMEAWMQRHGRGRAPGQTVEEFARELARREPLHTERVRAFAALFSRVRYGQHAANAEESAQALATFAALTQPPAPATTRATV